MPKKNRACWTSISNNSCSSGWTTCLIFGWLQSPKHPSLTAMDLVRTALCCSTSHCPLLPEAEPTNHEEYSCVCAEIIIFISVKNLMFNFIMPASAKGRKYLQVTPVRNTDPLQSGSKHWKSCKFIKLFSDFILKLLHVIVHYPKKPKGKSYNFRLYTCQALRDFKWSRQK